MRRLQLQLSINWKGKMVRSLHISFENNNKKRHSDKKRTKQRQRDTELRLPFGGSLEQRETGD